ncbi:alpha-keto acid decarboxylase family protein [Conexibacter sp. CPCC 206217]|uniref:alpha-keto acid decarboxylase family protein n=1 Tax=Conexibacter sp. CPCC 206217 TaxID=3064574 RepID=UPI00271C9EEE|nr:thiamine pyrophosphate-binding protein [Conexibacter sp. CPCC 206217]MDO8209549.1 thiamine pyrophosphate-binding protein [Conexibacter sp. CPCC 206217]
MPSAYTVADYLLDRLAELNVDTIFGVPGDFTLGLLDHVEAHPAIEWAGTANELGAGYAADGYARVRRLGVVCTTFGVGELSAINAIAGAYAEHVPLLQLVGSPATNVQAAGRPTHHTLGDGDFGHTLRMHAEITVAQALLSMPAATAEIDRVLGAILREGRPGYLSLPTDVAEAPAEPPAQPLDHGTRESDPRRLAAFRQAVELQLAGAAAPLVLADVLVNRANAERELHALIDAGGLRYSSLLWGRRVIDEQGDGFVGTYIGAASEPEVLAAVEGAERIVTAGVYFTDLISGFFSQHLDERRRIDLLPHAALVAGVVHEGVEMRDALNAIREVVTRDGTGLVRPASVRPLPPRAAPTPTDAPLTQAVLWDTVAVALRSDDVVLADQGTAFYGIGNHPLPRGALFIGQPLWASIGYTLPAVYGAALADRNRRPVLLIGDGAAQMTIAELGSIVRSRVPALIVVVDNAGYTVERAIHGPNARYNEIAPWRWSALPAVLGAADADHTAFRVTSGRELADALAHAAAQPQRLTFVQAVLDPHDVPPLLRKVAEAAAQANQRRD